MDVLQKACSLTCCASEANSTLEAAALKPCLPLPFLGLDSYASTLFPPYQHHHHLARTNPTIPNLLYSQQLIETKHNKKQKKSLPLSKAWIVHIPSHPKATLNPLPNTPEKHPESQFFTAFLDQLTKKGINADKKQMQKHIYMC